ncbi:MAG TPA: hypothetical protein VNA25_20905 [Phycisphaerae bacterium]|nr:hypothetical protein [Phycisphaerae bacterium]
MERTSELKLVLILAVAVVFGMGGTAAAQPETDKPASPAVVIYTKDNAPAAPKLEDLPLKQSVSQYGITWTFEKPVRVGQFVNGEWYVVGPATVGSIDPAPVVGRDVPEASIGDREREDRKDGRFQRNGSVVNPPPVMGKSGFDSRAPFRLYDPKLTAALPIRLKPGDALISSRSAGANLRRRGHYTPVEDLAILTCLKEPVPADAFRPGYMDRKQTIYLARDLKRELLPKLAQVEFENKKGLLAMPQLTDRFAKPWFLLNVFKGDHGSYQWGGYGQRSCYYLGQSFLYLCLDYPAEKKEPLLLAVTGFGIDCWGIVKSGHPGFPAWGGWNSGYKMPIVFGGYLLGDEKMASPSKAYPKVSFQEDEQTAYGPCWNGAKVVFCGHSGYDAATLKSRDKVRGGAMWGLYEHLHPSFWVKDQVQSDGYRRCCNSRTWQAQALVCRIMKLEKYWAHDAFFDYMDRWMYQSEDEDNRFQTVSQANVRVGWQPLKDWAKQGQVEDPFAEAMWKKYRTAPGMPPTDGWKTLKPNANGLVMPAVKMPEEPGQQPAGLSGRNAR